MSNIIYRLQDAGLAAQRTGKPTITIEMTAEEAEQIAYVIDLKANRINNEPLRPLDPNDRESVICIDCRMHGTWQHVPHTKDCPYRVARRLLGLEANQCH